MYELFMKSHSQTEADLGFDIYFFQIYQSLGSRAYSMAYRVVWDSDTNLLGNPKTQSRRLLARYCIVLERTGFPVVWLMWDKLFLAPWYHASCKDVHIPTRKKKKKRLFLCWLSGLQLRYTLYLGGIHMLYACTYLKRSTRLLYISTLWWSKAIHYQVFHKSEDVPESMFFLFFLFLFRFPFPLLFLVSGALLGWICQLIEVENKVDGNKGRHEDKGKSVDWVMILRVGVKKGKESWVWMERCVKMCGVTRLNLGLQQYWWAWRKQYRGAWHKTRKLSIRLYA